MPNNYKPVVVTIYRKNRPAVRPVSKELVLEIPPDQNQDRSNVKPEVNECKRGIQIVSLFGDEKI